MSNNTETVYVARGWSKTDKAYHLTKDDCYAARRASNLNEITLSEAKSRGFQQCKSCTLQYDNTNYDTSYQQALKAAAESDD